MRNISKLLKIFFLATTLMFFEPFVGACFAQAEEGNKDRIYYYSGTNRVSRYRKKIFDKDLIHPHELPGGEPYIRTTRGWKGVDTGQIYNRSWLAKKKGITLEELNKRDAAKKEIVVPPHDPQYDILPGEEESYPYNGPTGLEPDDDAD